MSYVTAITDRNATDIATRTSKAFINVADWARIYGNSELVNSLAAILMDDVILFNQVASVPTITSIPSVTNFNTMLANIERLRVAVAGESIPGTTSSIKDDYEAGASKVAPNYVDVNLWESTLDAIWDHFNGASYSACPTLGSNLTVLTGTNQIYIDCLDMADFNADVQDTGNLVII